MIRNFLAPAFVRIARAPFTSAANILTLALGLACFIAAFGIATYWRSADGYHANASRTLVIGQTNSFKGQDPLPMHAISSWTLARYLREDFPELEQVARAIKERDVPVAAGQATTLLNMAVVDPGFLSIFDFTFVAGDPKTALSGPNSVVLTQEAAARLFGKTPALGRSLLVAGKEDVTVTGVIAPVRQPSFMGTGPDATLRFDMLRDWTSQPTAAGLDRLPASMVGLRPFTFVVLPPNLSPTAFNARLPGFLDRRLPAPDKAAATVSLHAFPVSELTTFDLDRTLFAKSGIGASTIAALLALGTLTLVVACVNYANLATAQAASRTKEIGMRRVLGAGVLRVMAQAWLEAIILSSIAAAIALGVLAAAAPAISTSTSVDILYFLSAGPAVIAGLAGVVLVVALLAGVYPALILSRVRPAAALQSGRSRSGSRLAARILVAIQFASASFLVIVLAVTQLQRTHIERIALASHDDPTIILNSLTAIGVDYDTLSTRLATVPGVKSVSVVDIAPWQDDFYNGTLLARSADPSAATFSAGVKSVGHGYFETMQLPLLAGRVFDREHDTAPTSIFAYRIAQTPQAIIDRRFSDSLGYATPQAAVGQTIYLPARNTGRAAQPVLIVGVTEAEWTQIEAVSTAAGTIYTFATRALWGEQRPIIRISGDNIAGTVAGIRRAWSDLAPSIQPDVRFFDQMFEQAYRQYSRVSQLFILLASTAFIIASVGLLGIAVHVATRRRHEIAVRKTLGSSALRVVRLLLTDFSQPVLVGNLIAWPLAWVTSEAYLRSFADRIELSPAPFIISTAVTLAIAWAAIIGVVLRAATLRPAQVLRRA